MSWDVDKAPPQPSPPQYLLDEAERLGWTIAVAHDAEALERRRSILECLAVDAAHETPWVLCDITLRGRMWLVTMQHTSGTYQTAGVDDEVLTGCSPMVVGHVRDVLRDVVSGDGQLAVAS